MTEADFKVCRDKLASCHAEVERARKVVEADRAELASVNDDLRAVSDEILRAEPGSAIDHIAVRRVALQAKADALNERLEREQQEVCRRQASHNSAAIEHGRVGVAFLAERAATLDATARASFKSGCRELVIELLSSIHDVQELSEAAMATQRELAAVTGERVIIDPVQWPFNSLETRQGFELLVPRWWKEALGKVVEDWHQVSREVERRRERRREAQATGDALLARNMGAGDDNTQSALRTARL